MIARPLFTALVLLPMLGAAAMSQSDKTQGEASFADPSKQNGQKPPGNAPPASAPNTNPLTQQGAAAKSFPAVNKRLLDILRTAAEKDKVAPATQIKLPVDVGTMILRTIELHPLPPELADIAPKYQAFGYFVLPDRTIAIVNPGPYQITELLKQ